MEISRGNATSVEKTICTGSKIFTFLLVKCMLLCNINLWVSLKAIKNVCIVFTSFLT